MRRNQRLVAFIAHLGIFSGILIGAILVHIALAYGRITSGLSQDDKGAGTALATPSSPILRGFFWWDLGLGALLLLVGTVSLVATYRAEAIEGTRIPRPRLVLLGVGALLVLLSFALGAFYPIAYWDWLAFVVGIVCYGPSLLALLKGRLGEPTEQASP